MTRSSSKTRVVTYLETLPEVVLEEVGRHLAAAVAKRRFAWYLDHHHGDGVEAITCRAPAGISEMMVAADDARFFIPSYTGPRGWIGIRLSLADVDWGVVEACLVDAYRMTAPKKLTARLGTVARDTR